MRDWARFIGFFWTALMLAVQALRRQPLRTALTAFGILVGVAAVTIVVSLGDAAKSAITEQIDSLGSNALLITPRQVAQSGVQNDAERPSLTEDDAQSIIQEAAGLAYGAPLLNTGSQVVWQNENIATQITGTTQAFLDVRNWQVKAGQLWGDRAELLGEKVCVIGTTVQDELFQGVDAVGRVVRIGRHPFRVIGVLAGKGQDPFGRDQDDVILMPIATVRGKLLPTPPGQVHSIVVSAEAAEATALLKRQVRDILRQRHHIVEGMEQDFRIRSQEEFREVQERIVGTLSTLLLAIAAVSLVVGGIGVMNIMLVSVTERTREIGIRMAIGAQRSDILTQFVLEAIVLSLFGGAAGAALAAVAIALGGNLVGLPMRMSAEALIIAFSISALIGIVFGLIPARRAAHLEPIVALRRE